MANTIELIIKATGGQATREFRNVNAAMKSTGDLAAQLSSRLSLVGTAATAAFGALGVSALKTAASMEQTRVSFTTLLHSSDAAKKSLTELANFAARTPFEFHQVTDASKKLLAYGFTAQQLIPTLRTLGDAAGSLGLDSGGLDRLIVAFGQIRSKAKLELQDLRQLAEAGIPVFDILQKNLGLTAEQVQNIGKAGIDSKAGLAALTKGMQDAFGGGMERQAKTFNGIISNLADTWSLFLSNVEGTGLGDTIMQDAKPALEGLLDTVQRLKRDGSLDRWAKDVGQALGGVAKQAGNALEFLARNPDLTIGAAKWTALAGGIGLVTKALTALAPAVRAAITALGALRSAVAGLASVLVSGGGGAALGLVGAIVAVKTAWEKNLFHMQEAWNRFRYFLASNRITAALTGADTWTLAGRPGTPLKDMRTDDEKAFGAFVGTHTSPGFYAPNSPLLKRERERLRKQFDALDDARKTMYGMIADVTARFGVRVPAGNIGSTAAIHGGTHASGRAFDILGPRAKEAIDYIRRVYGQDVNLARTGFRSSAGRYSSGPHGHVQLPEPSSATPTIPSYTPPASAVDARAAKAAAAEAKREAGQEAAERERRAREAAEAARRAAEAARDAERRLVAAGGTTTAFQRLRGAVGPQAAYYDSNLRGLFADLGQADETRRRGMEEAGKDAKARAAVEAAYLQERKAAYAKFYADIGKLRQDELDDETRALERQKERQDAIREQQRQQAQQDAKAALDFQMRKVDDAIDDHIRNGTLTEADIRRYQDRMDEAIVKAPRSANGQAGLELEYQKRRRVAELRRQLAVQAVQDDLEVAEADLAIADTLEKQQKALENVKALRQILADVQANKDPLTLDQQKRRNQAQEDADKALQAQQQYQNDRVRLAQQADEAIAQSWSQRVVGLAFGETKGFFKGLMDDLKNIFRRWLEEMVAMKVLYNAKGGILGGILGGLFGGGGGAFGIPGAKSIAGGGGGGIGLPGIGGLGKLTPYLVAGSLGAMLGGRLFGSGGGTGGGLGAILGFAAGGPLGGLLGSVAGGFLGGLFGHHHKRAPNFWMPSITTPNLYALSPDSYATATPNMGRGVVVQQNIYNTAPRPVQALSQDLADRVGRALKTR